MKATACVPSLLYWLALHVQMNTNYRSNTCDKPKLGTPLARETADMREGQQVCNKHSSH